MPLGGSLTLLYPPPPPPATLSPQTLILNQKVISEIVLSLSGCHLCVDTTFKSAGVHIHAFTSVPTHQGIRAELHVGTDTCRHVGGPVMCSWQVCLPTETDKGTTRGILSYDVLCVHVTTTMSTQRPTHYVCAYSHVQSDLIIEQCLHA